MTDQDEPAALTTLLSSAICDVSPPHNLKDVLLSVQSTSDRLQDDLDALLLIPPLLPCSRDGTDDLLTLIARHCSAKEIIIAAQEAIERLKADLSEEESDGESESVPLAVQLIRLLSLFAKAFPRLVLRKSPSQALAPLAEIEQLLIPAANRASVADGRLLIRNAAPMIQELGEWVKGKAGDDLSELAASRGLLVSFMSATLEACADLVGSFIARRVFQQRFPRLSYRPVIPEDWKDGEDAVFLALDAFNSLGCDLDTLRSKPSLASLVLIAHMPALEYFTFPVLASLFPVVITSLQNNVALDATLAILLKVLCMAPPQAELSPDIIIPLTTVLPLLCSAHPDASTRHITFRILGRVLQLTPSVLRLQILRDLVSPSEDASPYMRTAAIGLVKEAVLEAVSHPKTESVFASPFLLQTIGPHVFRLDPPVLLDSIGGVDALKDSPEPARLVGCLNLYYILLSRDVDNRTGIRDPGTVQSVDSALLAPIRSALGKWNAGALPLAALQISLERVEDAVRALG